VQSHYFVALTYLFQGSALKIKELRNKYEKLLGTRFNFASFHDEILKDGSLPLALLEKNGLMDK